MPLAIPRLTSAQRLRFWSRVKTNVDGCWEWQGGRNKSGYGRFCIGKRRSYYAHRVAWKLATGRSPAKNVLHKCDNPRCVRHAHHFLGTHADNARDTHAKGRGFIKKGHELSVGERNGNAKLTAGQVRWIRRLYKTGRHTQAALAAIFKVGRSTISNITRPGGRWNTK